MPSTTQRRPSSPAQVWRSEVAAAARAKDKPREAHARQNLAEAKVAALIQQAPPLRPAQAQSLTALITGKVART